MPPALREYDIITKRARPATHARLGQEYVERRQKSSFCDDSFCDDSDLVQAFPWDSPPRYLLRDRDRIFGREFTEQVSVLGTAEVSDGTLSPEHLIETVTAGFYDCFGG